MHGSGCRTAMIHLYRLRSGRVWYCPVSPNEPVKDPQNIWRCPPGTYNFGLAKVGQFAYGIEWVQGIQLFWDPCRVDEVSLLTEDQA
jgi:hypothetical protein